MARVRYSKTQDNNILQSVKTFTHPTNGARYKARLNMNEKSWQVVDEISGLVVKQGINSHPHKMKIEVRDALSNLGVEIEVESRTKRNETYKSFLEKEIKSVSETLERLRIDSK